ncbi:hypothetical protein QRX50_02170 [Amycolatopsis carbonis]|uniref:Uncharacterized protein n=1 Tax=Amycolatopsis carbonis TaxID=715471 RepID=A0A9Y2IGR9_9PSEU|nr:hypothetical protein [Amycolatopsis sp. 2-15]WIX79634.1 hypothetical protein QRX50_02170 [Amycolatopsis sp. 2-15]
MRNVCRARLRSTRDIPVADGWDLTAATLATPEHLLDDHALRDWVWQAVGQLSPPVRTVMIPALLARRHVVRADRTGARYPRRHRAQPAEPGPRPLGYAGEHRVNSPRSAAARVSSASTAGTSAAATPTAPELIDDRPVLNTIGCRPSSSSAATT